MALLLPVNGINYFLGCGITFELCGKLDYSEGRKHCPFVIHVCKDVVEKERESAIRNIALTFTCRRIFVRLSLLARAIREWKRERETKPAVSCSTEPRKRAKSVRLSERILSFCVPWLNPLVIVTTGIQIFLHSPGQKQRRQCQLGHSLASYRTKRQRRRSFQSNLCWVGLFVWVIFQDFNDNQSAKIM